jgi:tetratricopeptide (TPR) repeat protein
MAVVKAVEAERERTVLSFDVGLVPGGVPQLIKLGPQELQAAAQGPAFMALLRDHTAMRNPFATDTLCEMLGITPPRLNASGGGPHLSLLPQLQPDTLQPDKCAKVLRRRQDHELATDKVLIELLLLPRLRVLLKLLLMLGTQVKQGVVHQRAGRNKEALGCYERALQVLYFLSSLLFLALSKRVHVQIEPDNADAMVAKGALYATSKEYSLAIENLEKALRVDPEHHNARK